MEPFASTGEIVWRPAPELIAGSNLKRYMDRRGLVSLDELQKRSTGDIAWFWDSILKDLDIRFEKPYSKIIDLSNGPAWPKWCLEGRLNIIHNCLDKYAGTPVDRKVALRWAHESETEPEQIRTYAELRRDVNKAAGYLRSLDLGKGVVVGVFMPMAPECVIAMLAIIKIGAIFLPLFSGFGVEAVASRLIDAGAAALITVDSFQRRGQKIQMKDTAISAAGKAQTAPQVIVWSWAALESFPEESPTESTEAEDVMMILYTSGTSGHPKGAVHTHCGFPVKAAQDIWMGLDLHADETLFWITDMGWMMGPWQVFGTLLLGATMLLYDGALDYPRPDRLWALVENHKVTTLGISPTLVRALIQYGEAPVRAHDLTSLRKLASTGEPWNPDSWTWLFQVVGKEKLPIINYSWRNGNIRRHPHGQRVDANEALFVQRAFARHGRRCCRCSRTIGTRTSWRTGDSSAMDRDDARLLERSATLSGQLLVTLSRRLGSRGLGSGGQGWIVVHPRTLRRHHQTGRQTARSGRSGIHSRFASFGSRSRRYWGSRSS
jgi:acetyl-CoA synthetase